MHRWVRVGTWFFHQNCVNLAPNCTKHCMNPCLDHTCFYQFLPLELTLEEAKTLTSDLAESTFLIFLVDSLSVNAFSGIWPFIQDKPLSMCKVDTRSKFKWKIAYYCIMCLSDFTFMNQINMIQKHNCYNRHVHFEVVIQLELVISIKIRVIKCPRHEKFNCILFENLKYNLYKRRWYSNYWHFWTYLQFHWWYQP